MECAAKPFLAHGLDWDISVQPGMKNNNNKKFKEHSDIAILLGMCMDLVGTSTVCYNGGKKTMIPSPAKAGWLLLHHYKSFWVVSLFFVDFFGQTKISRHLFPTSWTWLGIRGGGDRDSCADGRQQQ